MEPQAFELLKNMLSEMGQGLKEVRSEIHNQNATLLRNTISLEEHMKRSDSIEAYVKLVEENLLAVQSQLSELVDQKFSAVETKLTHVDAHVVKVEKFMGYFELTPGRMWVLMGLALAIITFCIEYKETIMRVITNLF